MKRTARARWLVPLAATTFALGTVFVAQACGSDASSSGSPRTSTTDAPTDASGPWMPDAPVVEAGEDAAPPDAAVFLRASGDPCRGTVLPSSQHYVASGLCARVIGQSLDAYRQLTFAPDGTLFAVTAGGKITRFRDSNEDGVFDGSEMDVFGDTGGNGNNCDIDVVGGYLYAGSADGVKRFPWGPNALDGGAGEDVVVGQASTGAHTKHTVHVWDGYLYVQSGSIANTGDTNGDDVDDNRALIRRFALSAFVAGSPFDWLSGDIVSRGLRNPNGFARSPSGRVFAVVNGIDGIGYNAIDIHDDNPGEQVAELVTGASYGFPFCFTAQRVVDNGVVVPPGTQLPTYGQPHDAAWCAAYSQKPATFLQAHSAPLDITFFGSQPAGGLPARYRGGAFIALHGSFDRDPATGYKIIWVPFDAAGNPPMPTSTPTTTTFPYETVFGGGSPGAPADGPWTWSDGDLMDSPRFSGVAISPVDGALYVVSDTGFYLYRVGVPNP